MDEKYNLNEKWCLWYHSIHDKNWDKNSYKLLLNINNLFDLKLMLNCIKSEYFHNCMFFFMRKGVFPNWEDENNINGSCISLKIRNKDIVKQWELIILLIIDKSLFSSNYMDKNKNINGLSISPKKEFNIFKLWFKNNNKNLCGINEIRPYLINKNFMYKKNKTK
jgi:hypothetical protein